jgi:hypothetical protein
MFEPHMEVLVAATCPFHCSFYPLGALCIFHLIDATLRPTDDDN